jgi:hypothetical protein
VPTEVIDKYKKRFEKYNDIALPEEMNGLSKVNIHIVDRESISLSSPVPTLEIRKPAVTADDG